MRYKKRFIKRPLKNLNIKRSISFTTSLIIILVLSFFLFVEVDRLKKSEPLLEALPIPVASIIESPDPLVISALPSSVLGFGTFDPIEVVTAVNEERKKTGSPPLRINETLMRAAQLRADVIVKYENFSHSDPYENIILGTVLPKLNYHFIYASENIGMGGNSGIDFVNGFMNSSAHRQNLLDPKLTDTGIGLADGPYDRYYVNIVVQLFAIPGGKAEYLGYSQSDQSFYETQLAAVEAKLNPLTWFLLSRENNQKYSEEKRKVLVRQKDILESILSLMREEYPLQNAHIVMIREYNQYLGNL